ncbi:MAG: hypothetical protein JW764_04745 [Chlorobiaceae bacterium]|nr:hypothetical protein [Chlorobiaceae bacterium]
MSDKEEMIEQIKGIAGKLGASSVPRHEFLKRTGFSERKIQSLFGSYNELVKAAGLKPRIFPTSDVPMYSDRELLDEVARILRLPEAKLTRIFFDQNAKFSSSVCERRFGGWLNTVKSASEQLDPVNDKILLAKIHEYTSPPARPVTNRQTIKNFNITESDEPAEQIEHPGYEFIQSSTQNIYGEFVNFRGLQHAPVNEQGVVFLFGMVCRELGYIVEIVKPGFPDCEAKRKIRSKPGMWQRVRIEFEYQSRNFRSHGHDPDQCDVIICWEHNWPECPIEVIELKSALRPLTSSIVQE